MALVGRGSNMTNLSNKRWKLGLKNEKFDALMPESWQWGEQCAGRWVDTSPLGLCNAAIQT